MPPTRPAAVEKQFETLSGLPLKPSYGPGESPGTPPPPGSFPYTRGIHESMYRSRLWTMRQFSGFGTAAQTNERFRYLLGQGKPGSRWPSIFRR